MSSQKKQIGSILGISVIFSIIAGGLAGVIATINTKQSLEEYKLSLQEDQKFVSISEVKPRALPGTYEEALSRIRETAWIGIATVRQASKDSVSPAAFIQDEAMLGSGAIVTNDGWVVFHQSSFSTFINPKVQAEIWIAGERHQITDYVEDSLTDLVMVKADLKNLTSLAFGSSSVMQSGDLLFALQSDSEVIVESITNSSKNILPAVNPSETFAEAWQLDSNGTLGAPLFNSLAELVGFTAEEDLALPLHQALPFIRTTIRDGVGSRAALGLRTVDIASTLNIDKTITGGITSGALVIGDGVQPAVLPGSPAELADVQDGDIIVLVGGDSIGDTASLAELISKYEAGDEVTLRIQRASKNIELDIIFAEFLDLKY